MRLDPADIREETSYPGLEPIYTWTCPGVGRGCDAGIFRTKAGTTPAAIAAAPPPVRERLGAR